MKMNIENYEKTVYGYFPEIPGNMGRVDIDSEWVEENVNNYKKLGMSHEVCDREMTVVVSNEQFVWTSLEMEAKFHEDIATYFK